MDRSILEKQQILDSLKSKSDTLKAILKQMKSPVTSDNKKSIDQKNRDLKIIDEQIENENKAQTNDKQILKETSSLIKEIESRLSQLINKST